MTFLGGRHARLRPHHAAGRVPGLGGASKCSATGCLDHRSLAHFETGILLGEALGEDSFWPSMAVLVGWEIVEPSFWPGETPQNQQCDLGVGSLGWLASAVGGH